MGNTVANEWPVISQGAYRHAAAVEETLVTFAIYIGRPTRQVAATCHGYADRRQTGKSGTTTQIITMFARLACARTLLR